MLAILPISIQCSSACDKAITTILVALAAPLAWAWSKVGSPLIKTYLIS